MEFIQYDVVDHVAVITLDRADKANAQHIPLLVELDESFDAGNRRRRRQRDPVAGERPALLRRPRPRWRRRPAAQRRRGRARQPFTTDWLYKYESEHYIGYSLKWRNIPKPTIAAVQGKCVAAGLMLCWPCDLIIAADNAEFSDPTARMGLAGVEYMAHAWEFGLRKAKEILFRSTAITAEEAMALGMVNKVVPLDDLRTEAMTWAQDIATLEPIMTRLLKRSLNATQDTQGFTQSLAHSFDIHELAHGISFSMAAANPEARHTNLLATMRETNKSIEERERAAASS